MSVACTKEPPLGQFLKPGSTLNSIARDFDKTDARVLVTLDCDFIYLFTAWWVRIVEVQDS